MRARAAGAASAGKAMRPGPQPHRAAIPRRDLASRRRPAAVAAASRRCVDSHGAARVCHTAAAHAARARVFPASDGYATRARSHRRVPPGRSVDARAAAGSRPSLEPRRTAPPANSVRAPGRRVRRGSRPLGGLRVAAAPRQLFAIASHVGKSSGTLNKKRILYRWVSVTAKSFSHVCTVVRRDGTRTAKRASRAHKDVPLALCVPSGYCMDAVMGGDQAGSSSDGPALIRFRATYHIPRWACALGRDAPFLVPARRAAATAQRIFHRVP